MIMLCCLDESEKQRVRFIGSALKFRMILHADKERRIGKLCRFHQASVRGNTRKRQPCVGKSLSEFIV